MEVNAQGLIVGGYRINEIVNSLASQSISKSPTVKAVYDAIQAAIIASGSNVGEIYNVMNYGAVRNAVVPASPGTVVTGTNNKAAFDACIAAAPKNAIVLVPAGQFLVTGGLAAISGAKTLNFLQLGDVYTNGSSYLTISAPGGPDRVHTIEILGKVVGKVNYPGHTRTNFNNNTTGDAYWAAFPATSAIIINQNVNSIHIRASQLEGFNAGIEMVQGAGNGSQENTFAVQKYVHCRYGIYQRSTDGSSWCDKNVFTGFDGGHSRFSGQCALKVDGNAASTYNGAFRSNEYHFLIEAATRIMECNGDMTEPTFNITIEAGLPTGIWDQPGAIQCRSVSPNYVRSPKFAGRGVLNTLWMTSGMGIDGRICMPIYLPDGSNDAATYVGDLARIDGSGNILVETKPSFTAANKLALPSNFRTYVTPAIIKNRIASSGVVISVGADDYFIDCTGTSGNQSVNLPSSSSNMGREIVIRKTQTGGNISVVGTDSLLNPTLSGIGTIVVEADMNAGGPLWRIKSKYVE